MVISNCTFNELFCSDGAHSKDELPHFLLIGRDNYGGIMYFRLNS